VLSLAEDAGANTEDAFLVFVAHDGQALGGDYEAGVDEAVDVGCFLVDREVSAWRKGYLSSSSSSSSGASGRRIISRASLGEGAGTYSVQTSV
jgi:hypothetical protein